METSKENCVLTLGLKGSIPGQMETQVNATFKNVKMRTEWTGVGCPTQNVNRDKVYFNDALRFRPYVRLALN